ncbi:hypothetical protein FIV42_26360 [Persicimonas caeni]|uniref:Uncharacterized protein n=1 Tax=Persicimonas caeni TaxID=2292766 RepID=A0A4Y6Q1S9_PERCE|nr:hypothetical protein [Persicimonas caeni]QDG54137.1 hypothetical protein FIV42_26360 [Persicimonas caeni]QED35358.1 hypothetical protein FRD00_26355 [Persicimonas caeni]
MQVQFLFGRDVIATRDVDPTELPREREVVMLFGTDVGGHSMYYVDKVGKSYTEDNEVAALVYLRENPPETSAKKTGWVNIGKDILVNFSEVASIQVEHPATLVMFGSVGVQLARAEFDTAEKMRESMIQLTGIDPDLQPLPAKKVELTLIEGGDPNE